MAELILLIPVGYLLFASIPLVLTDLREHRLPNRFTYSAIALSFFATGYVAVSDNRYLQLLIALGISLSTFGIGYLLAKYADVGMGDVKLLSATNLLLAWYSPWLVLFALTLSFTLASLVSAIGMLIGKLTWKTPVAMGPYLLLGFFVFAGYPLLELLRRPCHRQYVESLIQLLHRQLLTVHKPQLNGRLFHGD